MWLYKILILSFVLLAYGKSVVKDDEEPELEWPSTYTLKALRIYITGSLTEDYEMWRTKKQSRIDYNNGAVKSIVDQSKFRMGIKYNIHPEVDANDESIMVCAKSRARMFRRINLEDILPDTDGFEKVGTETLNNDETTKFYFLDNSEVNLEKRQTLWATYNTSSKVWQPNRYEVEEFNTWIGSLDKHEIWEFNNFDTNVDVEYFNAEEDCNDEEFIPVDDERITQDLLLMNVDNKDHVEHVFNSYKKRYNKDYDFDGEHDLRRTIFKRNMRLVQTMNRQNLGFKLTINKFSDRTPNEMFKYTGLIRRPEGVKGNIPFPYKENQLKEVAESLPSEYDTRLYGLVGTVKNQQECGSCWTFGTTVSMEGAVARANAGKFVTLSNQALVDCSWPYGAHGCDGGSDTAAYHWIMDNGMPSQADYGDYLDKDGYCHIKNMSKIYTIKGFVDVVPNSVEALKIAVVNHGPLTVSVHVNEAFQQYSNGIFYVDDCNPNELNHEVALVGYGEKDGETFWILKNSWGPEWGLDGYMHISSKNNVCGVATEPTYVVM